MFFKNLQRTFIEHAKYLGQLTFEDASKGEHVQLGQCEGVRRPRLQAPGRSRDNTPKEVVQVMFY